MVVKHYISFKNNTLNQYFNKIFGQLNCQVNIAPTK